VFKKLLQQADVGISRTSVVNPLQWLCVILVFATLVMILLKVDIIIQWTFIGLTIIAIGLFYYAYFHFVGTDPDSLRSERYGLIKDVLRPESVQGNSLTGIEKAKVINAIVGPNRPLTEQELKLLGPGQNE
jgi:hypothetical protein